MRLNSTPHGTEEYFCRECEEYKELVDVNRNWKCPICNHPVEIRIKTQVLDNSCFRIPVKELSVHDMVLLDRYDDFRSILDIKEQGDEIRVAIEKYKAVNIPKDNYILKLDGAWCH